MALGDAVDRLAPASLFLLSALRARSGSVGPVEEAVFRRCNGVPDAVHPPVWLLMQSGSLGAVFVAAGAVHRRRGGADSVIVALTGTGVWLGVKAVKPLVGRGRPADHLADVVVRGDGARGLGFPSGHAAVALVLAHVATRRGTPMRRLGLAIAAVAGFGRVYVGAHLPLDVVGGWAAGHVIGRLVERRMRPGT